MLSKRLIRSLAALSTASILCTGIALAAGARGGAAPRGPARGPTIPATLHTGMEAVNRGYNIVKADAANAAQMERVIATLAQMQRDVAVCKTFTPEPVTKLEGDKKTAAIASYRAQMNKLLRALVDLEDAVIAKKTDDIKKLLTSLEDIQATGHTEFIPGG